MVWDELLKDARNYITYDTAFPDRVALYSPSKFTIYDDDDDITWGEQLLFATSKVSPAHASIIHDEPLDAGCHMSFEEAMRFTR